MKVILDQPYSFIQLGERSNQEDFRFPDIDEPSALQMAYIVCDGVGGQSMGEVASRTVGMALGQYMAGIDLNRPFFSEDFRCAIKYVWTRLYEEMDESDCMEMATTLACVVFHGAGISMAHIGDSRIYHYRSGEGLIYKSCDHSLVSTFLKSGAITPEEAINHLQSNYITRCFGWYDSDNKCPAVDLYQTRNVKAGDYLFMCTDGVVHELPDERLFKILDSDVMDREKMSTIAAISEYSQDNNTAILLRIKEIQDADEQIETPSCEIYDEVVEIIPKHIISVKDRIRNFLKKI